MKGVAILGATGSIGRSALAVLDQHPGAFRAVALTAHRSGDALAELVRRCAERVQSAVGLMASMADAPAILRICREIDKLETDADKVMRGAISQLFRTESDVRQVIKLKAVYEALESATDKCQDVANVIESVVLENS